MTILRILTGSPAIAKEAARAIYLRGIYQATSSGVYVSTDAPRDVVDAAIQSASQRATSTSDCAMSADYESRVVRGAQQWRGFTVGLPTLVTRWYKTRASAERGIAKLCEQFIAKRQTGNASHA